MSKWFDQSNNANKLRQSYLKGFLDISGGGVLVRSDNSLNFYTTANETVPQFAMDATKIRVMNPASNKATWDNNQPLYADGEAIDVSAQKLGYLYNLTENVQSTLSEFHAWKSSTTSGITSQSVSAGNVVVAADASIGGRLFVGGDITANGNLSLAKNLYVGGNVVVAGSETINMDFYVKGNTHLDGNVWAGSNFYLYNGSAAIGKDIDISGELRASGKSFFTGNVSMSQDLHVTNTIYCNKIVVANDVSDNGTMEVAMDADLQSRVFVAGDASLNSNLFVKKDLSLNGVFKLGGDASLNSNLFLSGDASLNAKFKLGGDASLNAKLFVHDDASMDAKLTVGGATALKSTLDVTGATTLREATEIKKDLTVDQRLFVSQDVSFNAKLFVHNETILNSTLEVVADASLNANVIIGGDLSLNGHASVKDISAGMIQLGRLILEDNYAGDNMPNTIRSTAGDIALRPATVNDKVLIASDLEVQGNVLLTGTMSRTDTIVKVTEAFDVSNSGTRVALAVSQYTTAQNIAIFDNGDDTKPVFVVGHDNCVAINKSITNDASRNFDVSGNGYISGLFDVMGAVAFHNDLTVTGDYSSTTGNLTLTNGKLTTNTLEVSTTSKFVGNVTLNSHLVMDANRYIDQVGNESW